MHARHLAAQPRDPIADAMDKTSAPIERDPAPILVLVRHDAPAGTYDDVEDVRHVPLSAPSRPLLAAKRAMDIAGALVGLVVLGPLLAGVAVLIAAVDGRPVLFRQPRAGRDGRAFSIVKFRTMERGADEQRDELRGRNEISGAAFKMDDDPRVTRLGRILRRTSIDELPQLWNVLVGDMSLVGPRPHPFDDVARYELWHHRRLLVKPGVTGLWQISSRGDPDFDRWVELDLHYIHRWSLASDVAIVFKTIPAVLRGTGR